VVSGGFLKRRWRGRGGGVQGWLPRGGWEQGRERGPRARRGTMQRRGIGGTSTRRQAWHVARPTKQGRGGGADRWATATMPGGSTGRQAGLSGTVRAV
jgi:hypothetical protein